MSPAEANRRKAPQWLWSLARLLWNPVAMLGLLVGALLAIHWFWLHVVDGHLLVGQFPTQRAVFAGMSAVWLALVTANCVWAVYSDRWRRQAEEALRREHDLAQSMVQAAPAIVLMLDTKGRVENCNPFLESLLGRRSDELRGKSWIETVVAEADRTEMRRFFRQVLSGRGSVTLTGRMVGPAGERRKIEWSGRTLKDKDGCSFNVLVMGHDVTEMHAAQTQLVQSQRLAAIGQMVTGLAHESGNALQRSQACLEMLAIEVKDRPAALDLVYRIQIAQDHLHHLYEQVRGYAAPIVLRREPDRLDEILRLAWSHLEPIWKDRDASLRGHTSDSLAVCCVDRHAMQRVFRNILENSLDACADPVRIEVDWADAELNDKPAVRFSVRDNGPGMDPETRHKIFEPFYTTKTHGTGLGMAITQRIVEAHDGLIAVGDPADGGGEIVVTLPRE